MSHTSTSGARMPLDASCSSGNARSGERASRVPNADDTVELLERASRAGARERKQLLEEVVTLNMRAATAIASRYRNRGIANDDLDQVAYLGLVKAANGYNPRIGTHFLRYAVPTIRGEVRKHFRDRGWMIRPPRRVQELRTRTQASTAVLSQTLGRSPRPSEIAAHLGEDLDDVAEALATSGCFTLSSLDRPIGAEDTTTVGDLLGEENATLDAVEARATLAPAVSQLCERDRRILLLRFFRGWTQQEIAEDIGVTQMQVSRLLARIMYDLSTRLERA